MKSLFSAVFLAATLSGAAPIVAADGLAYEDNKLNFRNCSGENVSARWFGGKLSISRAGLSPSEPEATVEYQTWDGACAKIGWDGAKASFVSTRDGASEFSSIVRYIAWDGAKWASARTGPGFYIARIVQADRDGAASAEHFDKAARWLRRKDGGNLGAVALADALTEAAKSHP